MSTSAANILTSLQTTKSLMPTSTWLDTFLASQRPNTPFNALLSTATFRLLASDITATLDRTASRSLPADAQSPAVRERKLPGPVVVQVLDVEDVGRSRWAQLEDLEARERGEQTRGRAIVRTAPAEEGQDEGAERKGGVHKLLLQDVTGQVVYGFEVGPVEGVGIGMSIGAKLVLRDAVVARGMVLMEPATVGFLGGKIEALDVKWKAERKTKLKEGLDGGGQDG